MLSSARLPDFLVLGGMRCGSTTLHNVLSAHPQIFMPASKELHFFDGYNPELGDDLESYKQVFATTDEKQLCGEVTPDYLTTPNAAEKIAQTFESVKLIVILREPVSRLCSHYLMSVANGFEVLSFSQAVASEKERLSNRNKIADIFHSYVERSTYLPKLKLYADSFGKENVHIIFLEELNDKPEKVLLSLWNFLGVDSLSQEVATQALKPSNKNKDMFKPVKSIIPRKINLLLNKLGLKTSSNKKRPEISQQQKQQLADSFKEHNQQLSTWLNRKLPW